MSERWPTYALMLGALALFSVLWQLPTVHHLEAWHWPLRHNTLRWHFIPLVLLLPLCLCWALSRYQLPKWALAPMLIAMGWLCQWGPSGLEDTGLNGFRTQLTDSGHREFAWTGSRGLDTQRVIERYDEFLKQVPNQRFAKSKPPGTVAAHILVGQAAENMIPDDIQTKAPLSKVVDLAHRKTIEALVWLLPVLAALALLPLWYLSRRIMPKAPWLVPCFFALGPSFCLITMHFDQAVYPVLALSAWATLLSGEGKKQALVAGFISGALLWLGLFLSFGLLPAILMAIVWVWAIQSDWPWHRLGAMLVGLLVLSALAWMVWSYDPLARYQAVMTHHAEWKQWEWTVKNMRVSMVVNTVELLWWQGPPMAIAFVIGCKNALANRHPPQPIDRLTYGTMLVIACLLIWGRTFGEVARLWFYLSPLVIVIGAHALWQAKESDQKVPQVWLCFTILWTIVFKVGQDFW